MYVLSAHVTNVYVSNAYVPIAHAQSAVGIALEKFIIYTLNLIFKFTEML